MISRVIMWVTKGEWSHDAIIVEADGLLLIGDALMEEGCQLTPIHEWEEGCRKNGHRVVVLRPSGADGEHGRRAARWWRENVEGREYDKVALWQLGLNCLLGNVLKKKVGNESRFFCTEGVRDAWMLGAGNNPWAPKLNVTPGTTWKRWTEKRLVEVDGALTEEGLKYRVQASKGDCAT